MFLLPYYIHRFSCIKPKDDGTIGQGYTLLQSAATFGPLLLCTAMKSFPCSFSIQLDRARCGIVSLQWGRGEYLSLLHHLSGLLAPDVESSHYSGAGVTISHPCNNFMDRWLIARLSSDPRMGIQYVDYWGPVMDC